MKNKVLDIVFATFFMLVIIVPALFMNTKPNQLSEIDNTELTKWPELTFTAETRDHIEEYVNDRIGFRMPAINAYILLNDRLFHSMVHPLFMYGQEGHIYYNDKSYILGYQRLNTNKPVLDEFTDFLEKTNDYLKSKNIKFMYYLCPDKKTIYPEYFPSTINVKEDNDSVTGYLEKKLSKTDVDYIIPVKELQEAKAEQVIYNKQYDATHWNEFGAIVGHKLADKKIQGWFEDIAPLNTDDFELHYAKQKTLDIARFPIDEEVPYYEPKHDSSQEGSFLLKDTLLLKDKTFFSYYLNPDVPNNRRLLVFVDSYFGNYQKFYNNRFKEVYFLHRHNYEALQYYVNLLFPDVVIFETAERSILGEFPEPNFYNFKNCLYETPYDASAAYTAGEDKVELQIDEVKGVEYKDESLIIDTTDDEYMIQITGNVISNNKEANYDIYALLGDAYIETADRLILKQYEEDGILAFNFAVQRRYISSDKVEFIAVDKEAGTQYSLKTLPIIVK